MSESLEPTPEMFDFSVLVSCYFEEQSIDEFHARLSATMEALGRSYEIIFVNDGSTDRTFEKLKAIYEKDPNVTAIADFFKNVGQANAKTPEAKERLTVLEETTDGFRIAEADLKIRGPGELLGTRQTGLLEMRVAELSRDGHLLDQVQTSAEHLLTQHPDHVEPLIERWLADAEQYAQV